MDGSGSGSGGVGGVAGHGWDHVDCLPTPDRCASAAVEPHHACCDPGVPEQANACDGTESLENPATCTETGARVVYKLTLMEVEEDCNVGYELDRCNGQLCVPGSLSPGEGIDGVDNALAGLGPLAAGVGANLGTLNQLFSDALCGMTNGFGDGEECLREITPTELRFVNDANAAEACATVSVLSDGEESNQILNLSADGCISGRLGTISLFFDDRSFYASLAQTSVRMTLSPAGFSHGRLGAVMAEDTAWQLLSALFGGAATFTGTPFDISVSYSLPPDGVAECDGLSATFRIGGATEDPRRAEAQKKTR